MEVFMLKKIFFVLSVMSFGCAKHIPEPSNAGIAGFSGESFESTDSMCINGIVVAIDQTCAVEMTIEPTDTYVLFGCTEVKDKSLDWSKYKIIALLDPYRPGPAHSTLICADPRTRLYLQRTPTIKR